MQFDDTGGKSKYLYEKICIENYFNWAEEQKCILIFLNKVNLIFLMDNVVCRNWFVIDEAE